jgi:PAS domain S-box-containing protein
VTTDDGSDPERANGSQIPDGFGRFLPKRIRRNLTAKVVTLLLVWTLISGAVVVVSFASINADETAQVRAQVESETTTQATIYENWLTERWSTLYRMAESPEMQHASRSVLHQWLVAERTRVSNDVQTLLVADAETGAVLGSTETEYQGTNVYDRGLDETTAGGLIFISQQPVALDTRPPNMTLLGTRSQGRILLAAVPANTTLVDSQAYENADSSLYSLGGHQLLGPETTGRIDVTAEPGPGTRVVDRGDNILGISVVAHDVLDARAVDRYDEATTVGTVVVTRAPKAEAFAVRNRISGDLAIAFGLLFTLFMGTAAISMRSVTVAVNRLSAKAQRISDGSFDVEVQTQRIDEIGTLYRSIGEMRDSLRDRIEAAERREREMTAARAEAEQAHQNLREIIDLVPDLIYVKNRAGEFLMANQATAEAYGMTAAELEGKHEATVVPNVEDSEAFRKDDREVIDSGEPKEIPEETLTTVDGETKILQTRKIPYEVRGSGEDAVLGYSRDVTELTEYQQQLESQRDNLEVLNQVVRHDIRNHLQLISAYADAAQPLVEDDQGNEYLENVLEAADDAVDITTTAREVTAVMLNAEVDRHPVRLRSILEEELDSIRANHDRALVEVEGSIPDVEVLADEMLASVVRNLLTNAVQHNDKEVPEITVGATAGDETAVLRIADNGAGISDEQRAEIFERGEMGLDSEGTGLGLYLVKTLVSRYGGKVRVEENQPEGAVFVVTLPIAGAV